MKRKILLTVAGILLAVMLTSCLDAIEYITLDENDDIKISFMITISKSLFEMGGEGASVEETFADEVLDPEKITEMIPGAKKVEARLLNSDVDYGYLFTFSLPREYQPAADTPMAPLFTESGIEILLSISDNESKSSSGSVKSKKKKAEEPMDEMGAAIFSSAKYKLQISKKLLPQASKAYIETITGVRTSVELIDLDDNYLVNLPMLLVMGEEEETRLIIDY